MVRLFHPCVIKLDCLEDYIEVDEMDLFEFYDLNGLLLGHLHGNSSVHPIVYLFTIPILCFGEHIYIFHRYDEWPPASWDRPLQSGLCLLSNKSYDHKTKKRIELHHHCFDTWN